jgi:hypothetical protein
MKILLAVLLLLVSFLGFGHQGWDLLSGIVFCASAAYLLHSVSTTLLNKLK